MEKLVNCDIIIDIEFIESISGGNQQFDIIFLAKDKERYKLSFNFVWDMRYAIENGCIGRFYHFFRNYEQKSGVVLVEDSKYIKYFENQVSGTRPVDDLKDYIVMDAVDTVVEILTDKNPALTKISET